MKDRRKSHNIPLPRKQSRPRTIWRSPMLRTLWGDTEQFFLTHLSLTMHNVRNKSHKWTVLAYVVFPSMRVGTGAFSGGNIQPRACCRSSLPGTGSRDTVLTTGGHMQQLPLMQLNKLLLPQAPDSNQSRNNPESMLGHFPSKRYWKWILVRAVGMLSASVDWRVALCTFAIQITKTNKQTKTLKMPQLFIFFYWLALSVARKTLCCSWALSISFLLFFLFLFSFAFGALFPPGQCLIAILHLLDSAMVGHGIVSFAGFLTICRVLVSRPHLNPHVRLFLLHVPHSLQWPTSHPSTHSMLSSNGAKPSGHSSKQRPLCK